ncbi:ribosomal maturation YjgA family protein [Aeromonas hydrophila]|uniref:ribosomal maturation YjgA family protein n=1 Tax=Aeromonas hydrophila TaxID=644 RepID=UPI0036D876C8
MKRKFLFIFMGGLIVIFGIGFYAEGAFWRGFLGDVMIVVLLFSFFNMIVIQPAWRGAIAALILSFVVETFQYFHLVDFLGIENKFIRIVIGTHFDWLDIIAYTLGFLICLVIGGEYKASIIQEVK